MNDPICAGYVFDPAARTIDFSAVPGFSFRRLFGIEHKPSGKFLYLAAAPDASLTGAINGAGTVLTLNAAVDTSGMQAGDPLSFRYDPVPAGATDTKLEAVRALLAGSAVTADTSGTLAAGGAATPVAANLTRQFLELTNTGANPLSYRWGAAATALLGHILGPGQCVRYDRRIPTAALNLFSTAGTTFFVTTG